MKKSLSTIAGRIRLNPEVAALYEGLDDARRDFAYAIPVSLERITDPSVSPKQIILSIDIEKDDSNKERTLKI
ncbi:6993_t:CDS:2 [Funneliformis mosseae]|uniref:6993_t:CDS:1 n=1 Tax=Funneliformis mosseae TaxID=27381 RepID=A0A9N9BP12_FUNMO|nr:6993_t:CDS:2 [Funneliformis mosseae]